MNKRKISKTLLSMFLMLAVPFGTFASSSLFKDDNTHSTFEENNSSGINIKDENKGSGIATLAIDPADYNTHDHNDSGGPWAGLNLSNLGSASYTLSDGSAASPEKYYLDEDITLNDTDITITGHVALCLNGNVLTGTGSKDNAVITVQNGASLEIYDCKYSDEENSSHSYYIDGDGKYNICDQNDSGQDHFHENEEIVGGIITGGGEGGGVFLNGTSISSAGLDIYGGTIAGNNGTSSTGAGFSALSILYSTVNMYAGAIKGNACFEGAGVLLTTGEFNMYGGEISYNHATGKGGGISAGALNYDYGAEVNLYNDAKISYNTGDSGGGIMVYRHATLNIYDDVKIFGNSGGTGYGGGIVIYVAEALNMYGGSIYNNTASYGGGVGIQPTVNPSLEHISYFNMRGGKIYGNTADYGGGVFAYMDSYDDYGAFYLYGGNSQITNNYSDSNGTTENNVYVDPENPIYIAGEFSGEEKIGITYAGTTTDYVTSAFVAFHPYADATDYFYADNRTQCLYYNTNDAVMSLTHNYDPTTDTLQTDETGHWYYCENNCGVQVDFDTHQAVAKYLEEDDPIINQEGIDYGTYYPTIHHYEYCSVCNYFLGAYYEHDMIYGEDLGSGDHKYYCSTYNCSYSEDHTSTKIVSDDSAGHHYECDDDCGFKTGNEDHDLSASDAYDPTTGAHYYECGSCDYYVEHTSTTYVQDDDQGHYYKCTVDECDYTETPVTHSLSAGDDLDGFGTHNYQCDSCNYSKTHESEFIENDPDGHYYKCNDGCDFETTTIEHTLTSTDNGNSTHTRKCSGCQYSVDHTHNTLVSTDSNGHYYVCDEDCDFKTETINHNLTYFDNDDDTHTLNCDGCQYSPTHSHTTLVSAGSEGHYYECDEGCEFKTETENHNLSAGEALNNTGTHNYQCGSCDYSVTHYSSLVVTDPDGHYYGCNSYCGFKTETITHTLSYSNAINNQGTHTYDCSECGYSETHNPTLLYDGDNGHYYECSSDCGFKTDTVEHSYGDWGDTRVEEYDQERVCTVCGYTDYNVLSWLWWFIIIMTAVFLLLNLITLALVVAIKRRRKREGELLSNLKH